MTINIDDPNTESVSTRERTWFESYLRDHPDTVIEYGQLHNQVQPNAFFVVVYVHLEECIGIRMSELAEQKLKVQEALISDLLDDHDGKVRVFIHTPVIVEDQGHWSMYHCNMTVLIGDQKVVKTKAGYELQPYRQ